MRLDWIGHPLYQLNRLEVPDEAVARDQGPIRGFSAAAGLTVNEITFANWCGRPALLGLQDVMIITRS